MARDAGGMDEQAGRQLPEFAAYALLLASVFVVLAFLAYFVFIAHTPSLRQSVKGDFSQWITAARVSREAPDRLYDLNFERQRQALARGEPFYPYLYPPFVAAIVVPFPEAPFLFSFLFWASISAIFYLCAVLLLAPSHQRFVAVWLALASPLFLWYTIVYGQLSAVACVAVAGAISFERRGHAFLSGAALGLCVYKPTLLLWIVPMLLFGRRFRALLGLAATGSALAAISLAAAGWHASLAWLQIIFRWTDYVSVGGGKYPLTKFVDLNACMKLFASQPRAAVLAVVVVVAAAAVAATLYAWKGPTEVRWAATLGLTLLLNVYAPIYDSVLLVVAILVSWRPENGRACAAFMVAAHLAAWWSEDLVRHGWPPPLTVVLFGFVLYQWYLARRVGLPERAAAIACGA